MKKYVIIYHGYDDSKPELAQAWHDWFELRSDSFDDVGNPFGDSRSVTPDGSNELGSSPASGYSIVNADNIDAAEQLLEGCPIVDSVSLYEALPI